MTDVELTEADDGTTVAVTVGDSVRVRLPDNPTTGYAWELEPLRGGGVAPGVYSYEPSSALPGSPGLATWTFAADAPGVAEVRLQRRRPWEGDEPVLARFVVTIEVSAAS